MNYLAHLYFAKPTADSAMGNLLGDFCAGVSLAQFSPAVQRGVMNHRLVDKFTDTHPSVVASKQRFASTNRRFAGIALDVLFDHFLIKHWTMYSQAPLTEFVETCYQRLALRLTDMPQKMQLVVASLIEKRWLLQYQQLDGVGYALERMAQRIRFSNSLARCIDDIEQHYPAFEQSFLTLFPALQQHIASHSPEH